MRRKVGYQNEACAKLSAERQNNIMHSTMHNTVVQKQVNASKVGLVNSGVEIVAERLS